MTLGTISINLSRIRLTRSSGIPISTSVILNPFATTSSFGTITENSSKSISGKCHPNCALADASSKNTGMQPATIESNVDFLVGVSPGGCRQKLARSIGFMNRIGSCSQTPSEQSTNSQTLAYPSHAVPDPFSHSTRMLLRTLGGEFTAPMLPPPPANIMRDVRRERLTRASQDSRRTTVAGWKDVGWGTACSCQGQGRDSKVRAVTLKNSGTVRNDVPQTGGSASGDWEKSQAGRAMTRKWSWPEFLDQRLCGSLWVRWSNRWRPWEELELTSGPKRKRRESRAA
ncbi:hypothetical protein QJS04_geneDACA012377 [Acorus gramineus]|uniref:Uncharacterized protein n=1 Tax=Acorus gramineus TaxID=55184 RepID=A0AAV9BBM1_ACOGR|nr:hypothetical protein QJS04_geneDACA012377 [Acorus gramineus]